MSLYSILYHLSKFVERNPFLLEGGCDSGEDRLFVYLSSSCSYRPYCIDGSTVLGFQLAPPLNHVVNISDLNLDDKL